VDVSREEGGRTVAVSSRKRWEAGCGQSLSCRLPTYATPVRTTNMAALFTALERPVIVPLLHLTIWLSPLIWLSNLMSYLSGSVLLSTKSNGFAGTETWGELDFVSKQRKANKPSLKVSVTNWVLNVSGSERQTGPKKSLSGQDSIPNRWGP
jgi:hypothetical protein